MKNILKVLLILLCSHSTLSLGAYYENEHLLVSTPAGQLDWTFKIHQGKSKFESELLDFPSSVNLAQVGLWEYDAGRTHLFKQIEYNLISYLNPITLPSSRVDCSGREAFYFDYSVWSLSATSDRVTSGPLENDNGRRRRHFDNCENHGKVMYFLEINDFQLSANSQNLYALQPTYQASGQDVSISGYKSVPDLEGFYSHHYNRAGLVQCQYEENREKDSVTNIEVKCDIDRLSSNTIQPIPYEHYSVIAADIDLYALQDNIKGQGANEPDALTAASAWILNTETGLSFRYDFTVPELSDSNSGANYFRLPSAVRKVNGEILNFEWPEPLGNNLPSVPTRLYDESGTTIISWELETKTINDRESYLVKKISDYSGRSISYEYDGTVINQYTDVNGHVWILGTETVNTAGIVIHTYVQDPEGNKTTFTRNEDSNGVFRQGYHSAGGESLIEYSLQQEEALVTTETLVKEYGSGRVEERIYEYVYEEVPINRQGQVDATKKALKSKLIKQVKVNGEVAADFKEAKTKELPYVYYDREITDGTGGAWTLLTELYVGGNFVSDSTSIIVGNPNGHEYKINYGPHRNVLSVSRVTEKTTTRTIYEIEARWRYDSYNNLVEETNANDEVVEYDYDEAGNLITERFVGNENTQTVEFKYEYDSYNRLIKEIDPEGGVIQYQDFHVTGQAQKVIDELGRVTTYEYDLNGNLKSWQDPLQRKQLIFYDKRNEYYKKIRPDNSVVQYSLDGDGYALTETDELGHAVEYVYDGGHRVTQFKEPKDTTTSQQRIWEYAYNYDGKLIQEQEPSSHISKMDYQNGQLKTVEYPNKSVDLSYNAAGQVKQASWKADGGKNKKHQYQYDVLGSLTESTDTLNNATKYEKDGAGRVLTATDATGAITQYEYDARGNLLKITDPENKTFTFEYNKNNWLTKEIRHNGETREYQYYPNGNFKQLTDAKGQIAKFSFNDGDELTKVEHFASEQDVTPVKTIDYTYDLRGRMLTWNDGSSSAAYQYNLRGDLTEVTQTYLAGFSKTQKYEYFPNGNLKSYENPEGIVYRYNYNKNNDLQTVLIPGIGQMIYSNFDWHIPNQLMYPGGSTLDLSRDGYDNLTGFSLVDANGQTVAQNTYEVDAIDNVTQIKDSAGVHDLEYTDKYELAKQATTHNGITTEQVFDYDGVSNRLASSNSASQQQSTWLYNGNHQLEQMGNVTFEYDANGALIKRTTQQGDTTTSLHYVYDTSDRLIEIKDNAQQTIAQYGYDIFGYRLWKKVFANSGNTTTHFLYNQSGLAGEYDGAGNLIAEYHYSPSKGWGVEPLFTRQNGQAYFYQNDVRNAPERLIDTAGTVVWQAQYNAFGEATILKADIQNPIRFPGQYFDNESGLHYNLMRYYDPQLGRYLREDPMGIYGDGVNLYAYAKQSPFKFIDPDGRNPAYVGGVIICVLMNGGCWDWSCALGGLGKGGKGLGGLFGGGKGKGGKGGKGNDKGSDKDKDKDDDKNKDDPGCEGCFSGDTQVLVLSDESNEQESNITTKPIRDIRKGDMVLAKNVVTGEQGYKAVSQLFTFEGRGVFELVLEDEEGRVTKIEATDDHPFWVVDFGWMATIDLVPGLNVDTRSGKTLTVIDLKFLNRFERVYNFEVSDWHTYFVSDAGVLVHNCEPKGSKDGKRAGKGHTRAANRKGREANREKNNGDLKCPTCGKEMNDPVQSKRGQPIDRDAAVGDHVYPKAQGGNGATVNDMSNHETICWECNSIKSDKI